MSGKSINHQIAALSRWATQDPVAGTQPARDGKFQKFLNEVDAEALGKGETLSEAERYRRAKCLERIFMLNMAKAAAAARTRNAALIRKAKELGITVDEEVAS